VRLVIFVTHGAVPGAVGPVHAPWGRLPGLTGGRPQWPSLTGEKNARIPRTGGRGNDWSRRSGAFLVCSFGIDRHLYTWLPRQRVAKCPDRIGSKSGQLSADQIQQGGVT